jgi:hypothetical protein
MRGKHLPGQKRSAEQRERDRREIAAMLMQGQNLREMTAALNAIRPYRLSRQQVGKDVEALRIEARRTESHIRNRPFLRGLASDRLNEAFRQAYEAKDVHGMLKATMAFCELHGLNASSKA